MATATTVDRARVREALAASGPLLGLLGLIVVLSLLSPDFLSLRNTFNIAQQIAVLAILALGSTAVIIVGGIDLSVGSVLALSATCAAWLFAVAGLPIWLAALAGLAVGAAAGLVNGLLVTLGRLPAFIATLATLSAARGLALVVSQGQPVSGFPDSFRRAISNFYVGGIVPTSVIILLVLAAAGTAYLRYRPSGRALYAIGGNEEVARLSGLAVTRQKLKVYTAAGVLAALGGLVTMGRLDSSQPTAGTGIELDVIAAVVIGGASLSGGTGTLGGTLVGALIIGVLRNGLNLLNVSSFWQQVVIGVVIAVAVMTDSLRRRT